MGRPPICNCRCFKCLDIGDICLSREEYESAEYIFILKQINDNIVYTDNQGQIYELGQDIDFTLFTHETVLTFEDNISQYLITSEEELDRFNRFLKSCKTKISPLNQALVDKYNLLNKERFEIVDKINFSEDFIYFDKGADYRAEYLLIYLINRDDEYFYYINEDNLF